MVIGELWGSVGHSRWGEGRGQGADAAPAGSRVGKEQ